MTFTKMQMNKGHSCSHFEEEMLVSASDTGTTSRRQSLLPYKANCTREAAETVRTEANVITDCFDVARN